MQAYNAEKFKLGHYPNLHGFGPERIDMSGAILNASGSGDYADKWGHTAWWEAKFINLDFLKNLETKAPFDSKYNYGRSSNPDQAEYCRRTADLGWRDAEHCGSAKN